MAFSTILGSALIWGVKKIKNHIFSIFSKRYNTDSYLNFKLDFLQKSWMDFFKWGTKI